MCLGNSDAASVFPFDTFQLTLHHNANQQLLCIGKQLVACLHAEYTASGSIGEYSVYSIAVILSVGRLFVCMNALSSVICKVSELKFDLRAAVYHA